jgi:hypothetical protein
MSAKQLFLSCVSAEFKSYRETLRHDLDRPSVTVKVQEDFTAFGSETLCKLDAYIQHCEAVVHLVGDMTGAFAGQAAVDALLRSHPDLVERLPPLRALLGPAGSELPYTQWEAWLALYHGKTLLIACPTPQALRDEGLLDDPAQRALQRAHIERLAAMQRYPEIHFANADRLAVEVLRSPVGPGVAGAALRIHELPRRNPNFSGRDDWLEQVRSTLKGDKPVVVAQAIVGLGGIGKTQLALEYAHRQGQAYDIVWWVRAESVALRDEDLLALHQRMGLPAREGETTRERLATLRRALEATPRWLLVFDNVEQTDILQDILPRVGGGHVLITSRLRDWQAQAREVQLPVWSPAEAVQYLAQRTGQAADDTLRAIALDLGHLPLALEQAAAYMVQAGVSADRYRSLLQRTRLAPLDVQGASAIASIWDVSIRAVRARSQDALALLEFLAFMPPDDISRAALLGGTHIPMPGRLAKVLREELRLNDAVAVLRGFSLIDAAQDRLQIHRLVQLVVSNRLNAKDYRAYAETARRFQPGWVLETVPPQRTGWRWPSFSLVGRVSGTIAVISIGLGGAVQYLQYRQARQADEAGQDLRKFLATTQESTNSAPAAGPKSESPDYARIVAAVATKQLNGTRAAAKVKALLGDLSMQDAMHWADCATNVYKVKDMLIYGRASRFANCEPFDRLNMRTKSAVSIQDLTDFVRRNPGIREYLYTEIAIQRQSYDPDTYGARPDDLVSALGAAIDVLQGRASPQPFNLANQREALFFLLQLVVDVHRPLHVGTVYLDQQGKQIDPKVGKPGPDANTSSASRLPPSSGERNIDNLHGLWDEPPRRLSPLSDLLAAARGVPRTAGPMDGWPTQWANESLHAAQLAFEGLNIHPRNGFGWSVDLPAGYVDRMDAIKHQQLARGGAHLAQLLMAIWP